jgi:hypothetical protein
LADYKFAGDLKKSFAPRVATVQTFVETVAKPTGAVAFIGHAAYSRRPNGTYYSVGLYFSIIVFSVGPFILLPAPIGIMLPQDILS